MHGKMAETSIAYPGLKPLYEGGPTRIETKKQAENWIRHLLDRLAQARLACDVRVPGDPKATIRAQRRAERQFLVHYGSAIGVIRSLHALQKIGDVSYESYRQEAARHLVPTIVGSL